ncbi:unnamed protein product [Ambrosiozyma monospora]|uniref:Unnamed protein product n=1 Tax=Ambrosiozyma monospora TaxID=43982 RepID=A0ACB5TY29_AMBMO|nr:unnamed protein product [Ambrosiozyma monospora]
MPSSSSSASANKTSDSTAIRTTVSHTSGSSIPIKKNTQKHDRQTVSQKATPTSLPPRKLEVHHKKDNGTEKEKSFDNSDVSILGSSTQASAPPVLSQPIQPVAQSPAAGSSGSPKSFYDKMISNKKKKYLQNKQATEATEKQSKHKTKKTDESKQKNHDDVLVLASSSQSQSQSQSQHSQSQTGSQDSFIVFSTEDKSNDHPLSLQQTQSQQQGPNQNQTQKKPVNSIGSLSQIPDLHHTETSTSTFPSTQIVDDTDPRNSTT